MIYYIRCQLKKTLNETEKWKDYELRCLEFYEDIISYLLEQLQVNSTLENDLKLLKEDSELSWGMRMAITYRSERLKIL